METRSRQADLRGSCGFYSARTRRTERAENKGRMKENRGEREGTKWRWEITDIHSQTYRSSCAAAWARVSVCVCTGMCVCVCLYVCMCLVLPTSAFFSTLFLVIWFERLSGWTCRGKHFCNSSSGAHTHAHTHPDETVNIQLQKNDHSARAHTRTHTSTYSKSVAHLLSPPLRCLPANECKWPENSHPCVHNAVALADMEVKSYGCPLVAKAYEFLQMTRV